MSRRPTPPPERNDKPEHAADGEGEGGRRVSHASVIFRVPPDVKNVLQTMHQKAFSTECSVLDMLDLSGLDWDTSAGTVIRQCWTRPL